MRIALFSDTYLPTVNGVAKTLARLVEQADRRGHEVALVSARVSPEAAERTALHHQLAGLPVPMYPELLLARTLGRAGRDEVGRFDPQIVHVATESTVGYSGRSWALRRGAPLVTSFHTNFPEYARGYGLGLFEGALWRYLRWFHGAARVSFCPSSATRELLGNQGFHPRWHVWSRGVDPSFFSPEHREDAVRDELAPGATQIVLYVGRLAAEKRCDVAIEAFERVRNDFPGAALVFVGDGPRRGELAGRRVPGVYFAGYRTGAALAEAYAAADIFLFPSDTETFGNVVTEALASGLPVIVADKGGVRDSVIHAETGFLCAPGDPGDFAEALRSLLSDAERRARMSRRAREYAISLSWDRIFDGLFQHYEEVARA